jgi:iron complex outermembrane receptor protein
MRATPLPQRFTPAPLALAAAIAIALAAGLAPPAHAQGGATAAAATPMAIDIPAQPLAQALNELARQANLQMTFPAGLVAGKQAPAVTGRLTVQQALDRLLAGSGLRSSQTGNSVIVQAAPEIPVGAVTFAGSPASRVATQTPATELQTLPPVTVLGTRQTDVPLSNVPGSITIVEQEEIARQQTTAPRIEYILSRTVPGFNPTNEGVRQIRGRTAQVFINGVPVNEQLRASGGSDINLVMPDQLGRIEVARGANAAYGFGSPGGIIALATPRATSRELTLNTRLLASANPHQTSGSERASLYQSASRILGRFDYHVGLGLAYDGQDFDPDGRPSLGFTGPSSLTNSKESILGFDGSFGLDLGGGSELRLATTYHHTNFIEGHASDGLGTYRGTPSRIVRFGPADDNFRRGLTANLSFGNPDIFGSALKVELLASKVTTQAFRRVAGRTVRDEQTNEYRGLRSGLTTPLAGLHPGAVATYGFDMLRNRYFRPVFFTDSGTLQTFLSPDVTLDTHAPYLQLEVPIGGLRLSGGVRHERYSGSVETAVGPGGVQGGDIGDFDLTLFNAAALYSLRPGVDLFASFTQGAEITQLGRAARGAGRAELIDAQPAKSNQYELGLRGTRAPLRYGVAAFFTESDLLSSLSCDGINPCVPLREPRRLWGIEANLDWQIDARWTVGGALTAYEGERRPAGGDWRRIGSRDVPPLLLNAFAGYAPHAGWRNTLRVDFRGARDHFGTSTAFGEGRVDSVALFHFDVEVDIGNGTLQLGIRNLFNRQYFSIPSEAGNSGFTWTPEEGRRLTLAYAFKW